MDDPNIVPSYAGNDGEFLRLITDYSERSAEVERCAFHNAAWGVGNHSELWKEFDALSDRVYETYQAMLEHRSLHADALATKIEVCMAEYPGSNIPMEHLILIVADARRLGGRA